MNWWGELKRISQSDNRNTYMCEYMKMKDWCADCAKNNKYVAYTAINCIKKISI